MGRKKKRIRLKKKLADKAAAAAAAVPVPEPVAPKVTTAEKTPAKRTFGRKTKKTTVKKDK